MDLFEKVIDFLKTEKEKIKNNINDTSVEILKASDGLEKLYLLQQAIDEDIIMLDTVKLGEILKLLKIESITEEELKEFDSIKKIAKFLYDPKLPNVGVKKNKLNFINNFKNKFKLMIKEVENKIEQMQISLDYYKDVVDKMELYQEMLRDVDFYNKMSFDDLNAFFDFLESASISKSLVFDIISSVTINKLKRQETLVIDKEGDLISDEVNIEEDIDKFEEEIDSNAEKIIGERKQEEKNVDLSFLTEEEHKLLDRIEILFKENGALEFKDYIDLVKGGFDGYQIDGRKEHYFMNGKIEWILVAADYYSNLLPNIASHKDEVLSIIRFIVAENDKIVSNAQIEKQDLHKVISRFKENVLLSNEIISNYSTNPEEFCFGLSSGDVGVVKNLVLELEILSNDTMERIENNDINLKDLENVNLRLIKLMAKINEITRLKNNEKNNDSVYDLETAKTLVLLLKDNEGNFVPISEIDEEILQDKNTVMRDELQRAIVKMSSFGMSDNRRIFKSSEITYTADNGKEHSLKDVFGFGADRIRASDQGRTGYVIVPVHEVNREKLTRVYGNNIFYQNYNSIILIVGSIFCSSAHSEYKVFKRIISEHEDYIKYVLNLFKDPNSSVEELMNVIEESAKECKKISSGHIRGGK